MYLVPDAIAEFLRHLRECRTARHPTTATVTLRGTGGGHVPVRLFSVFEKSLGGEFYRVMVVDDTDRQLAMEKARLEHEAYHELIDSLDAIVWETDGGTGRMTFLSGKAEKLFGKLGQDGVHDREFRLRQVHVDDRERVLNELARAMASGRGFVTEYRAHTMNRQTIWLQDSVTIHKVDGRSVIRGVAIDITERKVAEVRAAQAAGDLERRVDERTAELKWAVSELESFSYTLAHDMRAPLRSIEGYAAMMADPDPDDQVDALDCSRRIMRSAQRLDALVQDVLKYSGLAKQPIQLKPLDLNAIIPAIANEVPGFKAEGARIEVAEKLLPVLGHEGFLSQCLFNLLSNAAKFVKPGVAPYVRIWTERDGDFVQIFVADNGQGIAPEDHVRIFKVFERCHRHRKIEGSGLGLAIVQRAVERMGGKVGVESVLEKGSKFWIQLRAYDQ